MRAPIDYAPETFDTRALAIKAFHKVFPPSSFLGFQWTVVAAPDGRFFPLCIGQDAMSAKSYLHFLTVG